MKRLSGIYMIIGIMMIIAAASAFSQDDTQVSVAAPQDKEMAIYGEVQAVNAAAGTISIQYYDYDSDSEKTSVVSIGADAKMENAYTVSDIKKGDWVDVTYVVSAGKNAAKMVSVEKEEPATEPMTGASTVDMPSGE